MSQCFPWARYNRLYQVAMSHQVRAMGCAPALKQTGPINKGQESQTRDRWSEKQKAYMQLALEQAEEALNRCEVPVGCVIVRDDAVIGAGFNLTNELRNGTRHAEFQAIDAVLQQSGGDRNKAQFSRCQLYVTCEPCIMCAAALSLIGIGEVVYGCGNDKFGGCGSILSVHESGCGTCSGHHHRTSQQPAGQGYPVQGGLFAEEAIKLLQDFYLAGNPKAPKPHRALQQPPVADAAS
eukprot:jgi/Chrzof1/7688/Cz02g33010.t1